MPQAAVPLAVAGTSAIGGAMNRNRMVDSPRPQAVFPGMQESYLNDLRTSGVGTASLQGLASLAQSPDVGPLFDATKASMQRQIDQGRTNLIEQYGVKGLRHSGSMLQAGVDYESQTAADLNSLLANYTLQARGQQLQAAGMGAGLASEPGLAMTPSKIMASGTSGAGSAFEGFSSGLFNYMLMSQYFGQNNSGGGGGSGVQIPESPTIQPLNIGPANARVLAPNQLRPVTPAAPRMNVPPLRLPPIEL